MHAPPSPVRPMRPKRGNRLKGAATAGDLRRLGPSSPRDLYYRLTLLFTLYVLLVTKTTQKRVLLSSSYRLMTENIAGLRTKAAPGQRLRCRRPRFFSRALRFSAFR